MTKEPPIETAVSLLKELRDTTPITAQRKRIDAFLSANPAQDSSLIEKLDALKARSFSGPGWRSAPMLDREEVLAIIRAHQAEQPQDVMERVAEAIKSVPIRLFLKGDNLTIYHNHETANEAAKAAIAAMPSTTSPPVSEPITPATHAFQQVKEALEKSIQLQFDGRARELAAEALAALPALMPDHIRKVTKMVPSDVSVSDGKLHTIIETAINEYDYESDGIADITDLAGPILKAIRPYLRTSEPVILVLNDVTAEKENP